jgi:hypothetical protein
VWVVCLLVPPGVTLMGFGLWWAGQPGGREGTFEGPDWGIPFLWGLFMVIAALPSLQRMRRDVGVTSEDVDGTAEVAESTLDAVPRREPAPRVEGPAPANWYPDPSGQFEFRYWDGGAWTARVASGGVQATSRQLSGDTARPGRQQHRP